MKLIIKITVAAAALVLAATLHAKTTHAYVSSQMPPDQRSVIADLLSKHAQNTLEPGDALHVSDGNTMEEFAAFAVPDKEFYRKNKFERAKQLVKGFKAMEGWVKRPPSVRQDYLSLMCTE